ncbi:MAG: tail fiber domain-containing protein [Pseudolabrys sp.]
MKSVIIRSGLIAALAMFVALNFAPGLEAQQSTGVVQPDLVAQGAWSATTTYHKDDLVVARGSTWRALTTSKNRVPGSTSPNTSGFWQLFARGFNPAGAWVSTTTYEPDDLVTSAGQTYRAKLTSRNRATTNVTFWELFAAKGASGPNTGISDGTTGAPSISFTGDTGTGIYSPGAGKIALTENGSLFLHNIGGFNTAVGFHALSAGGSGGSNTAIGDGALTLNSAGESNTAVGTSALSANISGTENTALGGNALESNTGDNNTALGQDAMSANTTGSNNTAVGDLALAANVSGSSNIAIGMFAGNGASAPDNSIFIGNGGQPADTNTIRIGDGQSKAFVVGIRGVTTDTNDAVAVLIDSQGQLGTVSSSRRYKEDIETMGDLSATLMNLRPVTFRYKKPYADGSKPMQYGLIAEEVADALPYLAVFKNGQPETVKYHELPTFLLAAYQQQQKMIRSDKERIAALEQRLSQLEARLARPSAHASSAHRQVRHHTHMASVQHHG